MGHYAPHIDRMFQNILDTIWYRVDKNMADVVAIQQMLFASTVYKKIRNKEIEEMPKIIDDIMVEFYVNDLFDTEAIDDVVKFICRTLNFYWKEDSRGSVYKGTISLYPHDYSRSSKA